MKIRNLSQLVSKVNDALGDFCWEFAERRKALAKLGRAPARDRLFEYDPDSGRDWAINQGGGTEIQFHLFFRPDSWGYGLGFNAQYVPFKNDKTPHEYILPFVKAYKALENSKEVKRLKKAGFHFVYGDEEELTHLEDDSYYLFGKEFRGNSDNELSQRDFDSMISDIKGDLFSLYCAIFELKNKGDVEMSSVQTFVDRLAEAHNLVLTGAPGTGKTYLARQIAVQMILGKAVADVNELPDADKKKLKEQLGFVQFHPSMDYTDFVEGLRPVSSGDNRNIGFELRDGVFKAFCKKAIAKVDANFDEAYSNFAKFLAENHSQENPLTLKTPTDGAAFRVFLNSRGSLSLMTGSSSDVQGSLTPEKIETFLTEKPYTYWEGYYKGVIEYLKEKFKLTTKDREKDEARPYVFVIDEINRGDIAKIFGELFFAIDPGYRGIKGRIKTQYDNLIEDDDAFKDGFYVPDNVYIIGTMNDIDRGVESMDFAIRRRFAWEEIKPEERFDAMMSGLKDSTGTSVPEEIVKQAKERMDGLNSAISDKKNGLGSAYQIGPSYFMKIADYTGDANVRFEALWMYHLRPLLMEYLRGMPNADDTVDKDLKAAYGHGTRDNTESVQEVAESAG